MHRVHVSLLSHRGVIVKKNWNFEKLHKTMLKARSPQSRMLVEWRQALKEVKKPLVW